MKRRLVIALLLSVLGVPDASHAQFDAGTQSVFAAGAGNRALAMGSAFVAAGNDASAILWNPAGLGALRRGEFQAVQSGDLGAGFRETYAAIAIPNWRLGTFGVVFRHFGVDGVEQRDDRNALVEGDLSDSEMELALGYGRPMGAGWNVGGAVKVQRQSVAGFSGTGLGLDLGVTVKPGVAMDLDAGWADRWTVGLSVRNLVEPSIRLDQESVPDPMAIRMGLAYQLPFRITDGMLAEIDIEKVRGVGARVRAGMEYRVTGMAAFRLGMNGSRFAAGTGLRWRGGTIDYTFESGQLASSHRFGLTIPFGATVYESRAAVQATEDAELERRLAEAFQARLEEQFETLLNQARMQLENGDIDLSLRSLGALKTLNPDDPRIQMLEAECFVARAAELESSGEFAAAALMYERALALVPDHGKATAGLYRVREESDRRDARSMELRQLFAAAMDAYAEDDLREARTGFARVVAADSTDREAARMLEWTDGAIAQRVGALIDQAQRFVASGLYDEAEPLIRRAEELDPNAPGLARIRAAIARERRAKELAARKAQQAKPVASGDATSTRRPRTKLGEKQLENLYEEGLRALQEDRTHDAVRYWELVWSARPDYRQVETYLKREYLTLGMEAFASGQLEQAVGHWKRVLEMDPDDVRANGYLERAREQMARSQEILGEKQ